MLSGGASPTTNVLIFSGLYLFLAVSNCFKIFILSILFLLIHIFLSNNITLFVKVKYLVLNYIATKTVLCSVFMSYPIFIITTT